MKKAWILLALALALLFGLGTGAAADFDPGDSARTFGTDDNRNIFTTAAGYDHSADEAIAAAYVNGETDPDYLISAVTDNGAWLMKYVLLTNPECVGISAANLWYNASNVYTSAYVTLYTDSGHDNWQKAQAEYASKLADIYEELDELVPEGATDVMIAHIVHDYIIACTAYDKDNADKNATTEQDLHDAYGALVMHYSACQGYSLAYMQLMEHFGINCVMAVSGTAKHAWNIVELTEVKKDAKGQEYTEKNWYHVDLTSDDLPYDMLGEVCHDFLLLSTPELLKKDSRRADFVVYSRDYELVFTDGTCATKSLEGRAEEPWTKSNTACFYHLNAQGTIDLYTLDENNALRKNGGPAHYPKYTAGDGNAYDEGMAWLISGGSEPYERRVARLAADYSGGGHILYYTTPRKIYKIVLDHQETWADDGDGDADDEPVMTLFFTAPPTDRYEMIFGLARIDGKLYYTYSSLPAGANETWIPLENSIEEVKKADSVFLSGGKIYGDVRHTFEVTVTGLSYSTEKGAWIMNGVAFETKEAIGFYFEDAAVTLELQEGSENSIVLNGDNRGTKTGLFAMGDLTIAGAGTLTVSVSGDSHRAYGIRVLKNFSVSDGAVVNAGAQTKDKDGISYGIFQWSSEKKDRVKADESTATFTDCTVEARGQRAAMRLGPHVVTKQADYTDMVIKGSSSLTSAELKTASFGTMSTKETVLLGKVGTEAAKVFMIASTAYTYEAEVINKERTSFKKYATLKSALEAAKDGATVYLLSDVSLSASITVPAGNELVLDLSGYSISDPGYGKSFGTLIINKGNLTITDSSLEEKSCIIGYPYEALIHNQGKLILKKGTLKGYFYIVENDAGAEFIMKGGMLTPSQYISSGIAVLNSGSFVMEGGQIYANAKAVKIEKGAEFILKGGVLSKNYDANYEGVIQNYGTFRMTGGSITDNTGALWARTADTYLLGGEITNNKGKGVYCYDQCSKITLGGDICITGNTTANLYLYSETSFRTVISVSEEVPLTPKASVGLSFTNTGSGGAMSTLPYTVVVSGLDPQARKAFFQDSPIKDTRLRFSEGRLILTKEEGAVVNLTSDCDGSTVALLLGGGDYEEGATPTLKAEAHKGFTFIGWYDGETCLGTTEELTLPALSDDVFAVARYEASSGSENSISVTLASGDYEARATGTEDVWSCEGGLKLIATPGDKLTLVYTGDDTFLYWIDKETEDILNCDEVFTFGIVRNMKIRAVTKKKEPEEVT